LPWRRWEAVTLPKGGFGEIAGAQLGRLLTALRAM